MQIGIVCLLHIEFSCIVPFVCLERERDGDVLAQCRDLQQMHEAPRSTILWAVLSSRAGYRLSGFPRVVEGGASVPVSGTLHHGSHGGNFGAQQLYPERVQEEYIHPIRSGTGGRWWVFP
ncbi:unnamed protein product [Timema podura]|uniref:Secreted protein n=1 Tax=Timema podura TaxID=61482 RepID=A0ABN7PJZ1_TIMPD|nr:unnamed protein product [Timema podura]